MTTLALFGGLLSAAATAGTGRSESASDGFSLNLLDGATEARCLDGTPAGFYHRPGASNDSWLVHFEGGGWCVDQADCEGRSKTAIGSSNG
jgi:hypothetical protein